MSYHWIDAKDYTLNCILLFDRWVLRWIFTDCNAFEWFPSDGRDYKMEMAKALYRYPHVIEYVRAKAPECAALCQVSIRILIYFGGICGQTGISGDCPSVHLFILRFLW